MEETEVEVSNIDSMVISLLNQDRDSFSGAFSDAMKERISDKLSSMNQEVSKELLSNVDEGWAEKLGGAARKAGGAVKKAGGAVVSAPRKAGGALKRYGKAAGSFAGNVAADPRVRRAARNWASGAAAGAASAAKGAVSGKVSSATSGGGGECPCPDSGDSGDSGGSGGAGGAGGAGAGGLAAAAVSAGLDAWKKKRDFWKARAAGEAPPLKLATSYQPDGDELVEMNYTFDSPRTAKKFMTSATQAGLNKRDLSTKGKTVTVGNIKDKDMKEMIRYLAKEMKASVKESLIPALQLAVYTDETVIVEAKNGIDIHITPKDASIISHVHDSLNEDNQITMRDMMLESEEEYTKILNFCKEQSIEEESNHVN